MKPLLVSFVMILIALPLSAQDTLRVSLQDFINTGIERSGQLSYEHGQVDLAENRAGEARTARVLPTVELNTSHGLVPGVVSNTDLPAGQYYLDPNLENDWENWAIFTRAEMTAVQPVFTWGAINKAIRAAELGAEAARNEFLAKQQGFELQLYELYYSYLLALEISRILEDAESTIGQVENRIETMREEEDPDLEEKDVFQFEIYRSEFRIQQMEVRQSVDRIQRIWNYIMDGNEEDVYLPEHDFLDPVAFDVEPFDYYQVHAMENRPELKGVEAGIEAYEYSIEAIRARNLPSLFLGLSANFANTPNRPRQTNPFIINNTNYMSAAVGFGIRQNLNFSSMRNRIERERIEYNRVRDLRGALSDEIMLELSEVYMEAVVAETQVTQTDEALKTTRNWVRHEQLNYDYGFGNVEDLIDSIRKELELRVTLKQSIFEMNTKVASLFQSSGIPLTQLSVN
ncbi:MAG: TolC family protein [Balneolaceae bacterium]